MMADRGESTGRKHWPALLVLFTHWACRGQTSQPHGSPDVALPPERPVADGLQVEGGAASGQEQPTVARPLAEPSTAQWSDAVFGELLGLGVKFSQGQPQSDLGMLEDLGVKWVRDHVGWSELEPEPGKFVPFPAKFLERLDYYRTHDIALVFFLAYGNTRAYPATEANPSRPIDPVLYSKYALHVAKELKKSGVPFVLEVWNEPHNFQIRPLLGGAWNGRPPSPWLDHYLEMVAESVQQVKQFDPQIKLLSDEDMWVLHYRFLDGGLPQALDGFAFHPYVPDGPEIAAIGPDTDWMRPYVAVDPDRSFGSAVRRLRDYGTTKLGKVPEMWITEWGWPTEKPQRPIAGKTVASYLLRSFILASAAQVVAMCWFSSQDTVDGPMGLLTNSGQKRPSYYAYRTMSQNLGSFTLREHIMGKDQPTVGVQAFRFSSPTSSTDIVVVWDLDAAGRRLSLSGPLAQATVQDVVGSLVQPSAARQVTLSAEPLYLLGVEPTSAPLAELVH